MVVDWTRLVNVCKNRSPLTYLIVASSLSMLQAAIESTVYRVSSISLSDGSGGSSLAKLET